MASASTSHTLLGMGNPLLDSKCSQRRPAVPRVQWHGYGKGKVPSYNHALRCAVSAVVPLSLLEKYGVKLNNAILAEPQHLPLYAELVKDYPVEYIAGGATQNSIRVAQWISGQPGFGSYIGAIGAGDAFGSQLKAAAGRDGVTTYYDEIAGTPTGSCAVLIHDSERSLVANLSAAEKYTRAHFDSAPIQEVVKGAKIVYSAGFFLTHASEVMKAT